MPEYKKKKVKRSSKVKNKNVVKNQDIEMKSAKSSGIPTSNVKVVKGGRLERKRKFRLLGGSAALIIVICLLLNFILPVGLFENFVNFVAAFGNGTYPVTVSGSDIYDVSSGYSHYFLLTDTKLSAYNNSGKEILSIAHGYANPYMSTSETRALIFDQGGTQLCVYNLKNQTNNLVSEDKIITADISRSGTYAVVTHSKSYASTVTVYDKNSKVIYTWNSAVELVNSVTVAPNGKQIAVGTINVKNGQYESKLLILDFDSADAKYTTALATDTPILLDSNNTGVSVICEKSYYFIRWNNNEKSEIKSEYSIDKYRKSGNRMLLVLNHEGNKNENIIMLLSSSGKKLNEFKLDGAVTDIEPKGNHVYCLSDSNVLLLDKNGEILRKGSSDYGAVRLKVLNTNTVAVASNTTIKKVSMEKEVE